MRCLKQSFLKQYFRLCVWTSLQVKNICYVVIEKIVDPGSELCFVTGDSRAVHWPDHKGCKGGRSRGRDSEGRFFHVIANHRTVSAVTTCQPYPFCCLVSRCLVPKLYRSYNRPFLAGHQATQERLRSGGGAIHRWQGLSPSFANIHARQLQG